MAVLLAVALAVLGCNAPARRAGPTPASRSGWFLAVAEEHGDRVQFWLLDPRDVSQRRHVADVQHQQNWGVRASVSPDGRTLVYAVLPAGAVDPDTQGELWALPVGGKPRRLASGVDLRSDLVWSPDSAWVTYERLAGTDGQLRRVNAGGAGDQLLQRDVAGSRWYPMGYQPDGGAVILAHLTPSGTEVLTQRIGGSPAQGEQISPGASRDFTVSPDGRPALLALMPENGRMVYRAVVMDGDGTANRMTAGGAEETGIAWDPRTGAATVGEVTDAGATAVAATGVAILRPPDGFDVPVTLSPDGAYLAVRHFSGATTDQPGDETVVLVGEDGVRVSVSGAGPLTVAGWVSTRR